LNACNGDVLRALVHLRLGELPDGLGTGWRRPPETAKKNLIIVLDKKI
jgi:hypothetical protein